MFPAFVTDRLADSLQVGLLIRPPPSNASHDGGERMMLSIVKS